MIGKATTDTADRLRSVLRRAAELRGSPATWPPPHAALPDAETLERLSWPQPPRQLELPFGMEART